MKRLQDLVRTALRLPASDPGMKDALVDIGTRVVHCVDPMLLAAADVILRDLRREDDIPFPPRAIAVGIAVVGDDGRFYIHASPPATAEGHAHARIALTGATQALACAVAAHIKIHTIGDW